MKDKTLHGVETKKLSKNFWTYVVLLSALGAMTFFGVCDPTRQGGGGGMSGSAAVVGDEVISRMEFTRAYRTAYDRYQKQFADAFDPGALKLAHSVMKDLIDDRAIYAKAVELGMRVSDDEIIEMLRSEAAFKDESGKFSEDGFQRFLGSQGYTEASFMEEIRRSLTVQKFQHFMRESIFVSSKAAELDYRLSETKLNVEYLKFDPQSIAVEVTPDEVTKLLADDAGKKKVKDYFETNPKEFNQEEQLKARHVLVSFKGARNATAEAQKREKDAAKVRAEEVIAKAKAAGADFAQIAKDMTDEEAGKSKGGDLGWFTKAAMVKEFSDAAFALKPGEISGVVESPFGFHIIKVEDHKAAKVTKFEDAERQIAETVLQKEKRPVVAKERANKVLAELKEGKDVTAQLAADSVAWAETGDVAASSSYLPGIGTSKEVSDALVALNKVGQIYPQAVDVRGNLYILRLKARQDADLSKLDKEKRKELAEQAAMTEGFALYRSFEKKVTDDLDKSKKVWMNPEYLALDDQRRETAEGS